MFTSGRKTILTNKADFCGHRRVKHGEAGEGGGGGEGQLTYLSQEPATSTTLAGHPSHLHLGAIDHPTLMKEIFSGLTEEEEEEHSKSREEEESMNPSRIEFETCVTFSQEGAL